MAHKFAQKSDRNSKSNFSLIATIFLSRGSNTNPSILNYKIRMMKIVKNTFLPEKPKR